MTFVRILTVGTILLEMLSVSPSSFQESTLIAPGATVQLIATGFAFLEGPAADSNGGVYFTDIPNNRIHHWSSTDGVKIIKENSGGANGLRINSNSNLVVCEMESRRVTEINPHGESQVLADQFEGSRFNSPNDLWIDPKGGIYFTDPRYGATSNQEISGYHVYYIIPDRSEVRRVVNDLIRPNGIIGTPDGTRVYIADHGAGRTYRYTPTDNGSLSEKDLFVAQGSDGMTMDEHGNLYLTGPDITVYNSDGDIISSIAVPEPPSNLTFGGPEGTTLFITARTSLYSLELLVGGQ